MFAKFQGPALVWMQVTWCHTDSHPPAFTAWQQARLMSLLPPSAIQFFPQISLNECPAAKDKFSFFFFS